MMLACTAAKAQTTRPDYIYNNGEKLVYTLSYNSTMWPRTDVGTVVFSVKDSSYEGTPSYVITANAATNNFFSVFFRLKDSFNTHVDKATMRPLAHSCTKEEANYRFGSKISFDWNTRTATSWYKNYRLQKEHHKTMPLTSESMDPIGYFYKIRSEDFSAWLDGEERNIKIVLEDTVQNIKYKLLKRETISTADYKNVPTLKFSCQLSHSVSEDQKTRDSFYIWISDDRNKVPVLVETPTKIGKVKARLTGFSGLKYANNSILK